MKKPVVDCALYAFIKGLPDEISTFVDTRNPKDVVKALEHVLHIEERLRQTERVSRKGKRRSSIGSSQPSQSSRNHNTYDQAFDT